MRSAHARHMRKRREQLGRQRNQPQRVHRMEEREVGETRLLTEDETPLRKMGVEKVELRAKLLAQRRCIGDRLLERDLHVEHPRAVFEKARRKHRRAHADRPHREPEQLLLPRAEHHAEREAVVRKQRRLRMQAVDRARDQIGVAVDVGADLEHRGLAVSTGQRGKIGLRHQHRNEDRTPRQALHAETRRIFSAYGDSR